MEDEYVETAEEHWPIAAPVSALHVQLDPSQEGRAQSVGMGERTGYWRIILGAKLDLKKGEKHKARVA